MLTKQKANPNGFVFLFSPIVQIPCGIITLSNKIGGFFMTESDNHSIKLLQQVFSTSDKMAISTSLNGQADVRIINYVWFVDEPNKLYFSSVRGTTALKLYQAGADIAFITIPHDGTPYNPFVRAKGVKATPSDKTMSDLLPRYLELVPGYQKTWDAIGSSLVVYEINLQQVHVDAGINQEKIDLQFN